MKLKIVFWSFSLLFSFLSVTANHGGNLRNITPNPTGISPFWWIIFIAIVIGLVYFFYWLLSKEKKEF